MSPPPPFDNPLFTHVGDFHILSDINARDGLTTGAVVGHGGPAFGFFGYPNSRAFAPRHRRSGDRSMRYRFLYVPPSAARELRYR